MRRRNRLFETPIPSALGDNHVTGGIQVISQLCQRAMSVMTEYTMTREETIRALFEPEELDKAVAAKHLISPESPTMSYDTVAKGVSLFINYNKSMYPPINEGGYLVLQGSSVSLTHFIESVRAIHEQFEEIKGVLRWLNRNATPGAIRYYFPTASALCPQSPPLIALPHVPSRYTQPKDINNWMQLIKNAAATYAGTQMLPATAKYRQRDSMWLTFSPKVVQSEQVLFHTDIMTYNF